MKVCVAVLDVPERAEICYALATLLERAGLPYEFEASGGATQSPGCVRLYHGPAAAHVPNGIVIPAEDPALWQTAEPELVWLDGVPVLYAGEKPPSLFSRHEGRLGFSFDLARGAFWLLSRQEELGNGSRDAYGRFDCSASWLVRHGMAEVPVVDLYARLLARLLLEAAVSAGQPLLRKLSWPQGRSYGVVLSHDVDDAGRLSPQQGMRMLARATSQGSFRGMARGIYYALAGVGRSLSRRSDPYWNFETVMQLEAEANYRSTFFFVSHASSARRDPPYEVDTPNLRDLLSRLRAGGWEVGTHGSFDSYLDSGALRVQREKLERVSGGPVRGIRQHYLRLQVPETFQAQADAGFAYDATVGYRATVGFRAGAAFPFFPFDQTVGGQFALLELPLTVMDGPLFWQLNLSLSEASARTLALLDTVRSVGGLAVLLWHQRVWYEKRYPGWSQVYEQVVRYLFEEGQSWVATAGQVADWWLAREAVQLESISATGPAYRWRYCAGQAIAELAFTLQAAGAGGVTVTGAEVAVRAHEDGFRLEFQPLAAGQSFEIEWMPEVGTS